MEKEMDANAIVTRLIVCLDESAWAIVKPVISGKSDCAEFENEEDCAVFADYLRGIVPGVAVEVVPPSGTRAKDGVRARIGFPESWRRAYAAQKRWIDGMRGGVGLYHTFVCAAARLYGAVDVEELSEIVLHWWDDAPWLRETLAADTPEARREAARGRAEGMVVIADARSFGPYATVYVQDGLVVSMDKYPPPESPDAPRGKTLAAMLELRKGKARWHPKTLDDFMGWGDPGHRDWPDEYDALDDFIAKLWELDLDDEEDSFDLDCAMCYAHDALAAGRGWTGAVDAMRPVLDFADLEGKELTTLARILCKAANATRQDANWGFTPDEMVAKFGHGDLADPEAVSFGFASDPGTPVVRAEAKVGRNDLCPCGSGKKYKKCCGA